MPHTNVNNNLKRRLEDMEAGSEDKLIRCPYNPAHKIKVTEFGKHLIWCRQEKQPELTGMMVLCPYNSCHLVFKTDMCHHLRLCQDCQEFISRPRFDRVNYKDADDAGSIGSMESSDDDNDPAPAGYVCACPLHTNKTKTGELDDGDLGYDGDWEDDDDRDRYGDAEGDSEGYDGDWEDYDEDSDDDEEDDDDTFTLGPEYDDDDDASW